MSNLLMKSKEKVSSLTPCAKYVLTFSFETMKGCERRQEGNIYPRQRFLLRINITYLQARVNLQTIT